MLDVSVTSRLIRFPYITHYTPVNYHSRFSTLTMNEWKIISFAVYYLSFTIYIMAKTVPERKGH